MDRCRSVLIVHTDKKIGLEIALFSANSPASK